MDRSPRRSTPPKHPSGYPAADDAPVHLAPAVDVREGARRARVSSPVGAPSGSWSPLAPTRASAEPQVGGTAPMARGLDRAPSAEAPPSSSTDGALYTLAVPVEERHSRPPSPEPDEPAPRTLAYEPARSRLGAPIPIGGPYVATPPQVDVRPSSERPPPSALQVGSLAPEPLPAALAALLVQHHEPGDERASLARELASIGALDERPDRDVERDIGAKATLSRARALRFRLALLDAFAEAPPANEASAPGTLPIDLAIDAMVLVGFADGAPFARHLATGLAMPFVLAMVRCLRAARPDLPRSALRDRGVASIAGLTVAGYRATLEALSRAALETPKDARALVVDAAASVATAPAVNPHRLAALGDLERALSLRAGVSARALEQAQRRRG